jgi:hypothetical protein
MDPRILTDAWYLVATGPLLPLLQSIVNQPKWSAGVQAVVGAVLSAIVGVAVAWHAGILGTNIGTLFSIGNAVVLFNISSGFYKHFWKPTKVAPAIENATSVGGK